MLEVIVTLAVLYGLWKLFVDGWLFKIIVFIFGWIGMYVCLAVYVAGAKHTALTLGTNTHISWAAVIPTIICIAVLACTRSES